MVRKYLLPLLAIVGVAAAVHAVQEASTPVTSQPAVMTPAPNPFHAGVAGAGIVEGSVPADEKAETDLKLGALLQALR